MLADVRSSDDYPADLTAAAERRQQIKERRQAISALALLGLAPLLVLWLAPLLVLWLAPLLVLWLALVLGWALHLFNLAAGWCG